MSKMLKIFDTTLRDGEQSPGCSMNLQEKLEMARQLEKLGVDIIEAGFAIASPGDFQAVSAIAKVVQNSTVASLSRALKKDIDQAYEAVRHAVSPRIHTFIATSPIHLQYKLKMNEDQVFEQAVEMVKYAKSRCCDVEFSAEDATRSRWPYLKRIFEGVIRAGATVLNVPDTVGYTTPQEYYELITYLRENVEGIDKVDISVHCHNDLGMAVANTLAAAKAGATQLECTINGIGERAGNAALEEIVMALNTRKDFYQLTSNVDTTQIYRTSRLLTTVTGVEVQPHKAIVGQNAFAHESGIHQHGVLADKSTYEIMSPESIGLTQNHMVLGKHSGRHAFEARLQQLGHSLTKEQIDSAFMKFKELADKKKVVLDQDLEALVVEKTIKVPEKFVLEHYGIQTGDGLTPQATIKAVCKGQVIEKTATGDGPVDAFFKAIDAVLEMDLALEDYKIRSVTSGPDAQGEATVRVGKDGKSYLGRAVSTDVIEASAMAYINAINKLLNEVAEERDGNEAQNPAL